MSCSNRLPSPSFHFFFFFLLPFGAFDAHVIHSIVHSQCMRIINVKIDWEITCDTSNWIENWEEKSHPPEIYRSIDRSVVCLCTVIRCDDDDMAFNGDNAIVYLSKIVRWWIQQMNWVGLLSTFNQNKRYQQWVRCASAIIAAAVEIKIRKFKQQMARKKGCIKSRTHTHRHTQLYHMRCILGDISVLTYIFFFSQNQNDETWLHCLPEDDAFDSSHIEKQKLRE